MARGIAVIGDGAGAAQAALTLTELGVEVKLIMSSQALSLDNVTDSASVTAPEKLCSVWPLLLRAASHPLVTLHTNSRVRAIAGKQGKFTVRLTTYPRYVQADLCTACGRCEEACSVQVPFILDGRKVTRSAIHAPVPGKKTIPSAYYIEKSGVAPCRASCPLGINVQGFVSLLSKGKVDEALSLINEVAPLAGVLGRVCTHPCEDNCKRSEVDSPVFIPALHRYAADNAPSGINYKRKAPARSRKEKIAIVGSGPAGLAAAWELARRGYGPTIFESHAVVGGMVATGIPRFRLPLEVREREVAAIKDLGVDIMTGVMVGRDVTISDLRERGYRAFFLAIGAHQNRGLGIPGEELEGVVDAISLLFALNLKVGASVGSNVVVIGGGNSAVDSARTAKRRSKGVVRILYRRTMEEMTAVADEVQEAINEGISIEYLTNPLEILGDGTKVTGIRCQRMKMGDMGEDGRRRPEPIPGSEFVIDADHVVIAIGQRPNTSMLNIRWLEIDSDDSTIKVDPLTLETRIPGIFSGGDCVTGPNNVVEAVAAGLRAAESIDRYLRGRDLRKGRSLEKPQTVEVDIRERDAAYYKRARMPAIPPYKRMGKFEEIALGLPLDVGRREAERCLNCALCSECMECEQVCELGAVLHKDREEHVDIGAELIINFASDDGESEYYLEVPETAQSIATQTPRPGVYTVELFEGHSLQSELAQASATALEAAAELRLKEGAIPAAQDNPDGSDDHSDHNLWKAEAVSTDKARIGVFLCRCGGSINSVIDFNQVTNELLQLPGLCTVQETAQACSEEGANRMAARAAEWKLDKMVLAACRCCGLDQICFSCTDRRVMCQQNLGNYIATYLGSNVEFVNIREQCALVHEDDPAGATRKAIDIISAGVARSKKASAVTREERPLTGGALILGAGIRGLAAAKNLASQIYSVTVIAGPEADTAGESQRSEYLENRESLLKQLDEQGITVRPWPQNLELDGSPGNYNAVLNDGSQNSQVEAGAIILDIGKMQGEVPPEVITKPGKSRLGRIFTRRIGSKGLEDMQFAIKDTAGIFVMYPDEEDTPWEQVLKGASMAARASGYLYRGSLSPMSNAVSIDSKLCRGCGDCAAVCSYIEMRESGNGTACAYVDRALCLGCGVCIAHCPTGAITQAFQSDANLSSTLEALLGKTSYMVEVA